MSEMDLNTKVKVWNRGAGSVSYNIPDLRISREWVRPGDMIPVTLEELQALKYIPGGQKLLEKYLLIKDQDACEFLELPTDPEYFYDENDVRALLSTGSVDQLLDCLEFAPSGVISLIKKIAVEEKLDSSEKREIINNALKINIDAMIKNNAYSKEEAGTNDASTTGKARRSTPINTTTNGGKYNVVKRNR